MKNKIITVVLLLMAVVTVVAVKNSKRRQAEDAAAGCQSGMCSLANPEGKMSPEGAAQAIPAAANALPRLLDLGAGKCIPCKMMAPILDEMKQTFAGSLNIEFIDVWENPDAAKPYNIRIIPTQIFFDADGNELFRHEGFFAREDMLTKWQELGFEFPETARK